MSLTKKVYLTISGYDIKLSDNLTFYQKDQLKLIFYINEYGIDYGNNATTRALMPVNPLNAILFIENPNGVDSVSSAKIEDNAVTFYLDSTHTQYVGVSRMQLRLFDQDGCAITLPHFTFEIRENIYGSGDVRFQNVVMVDQTGTVILTEDNDMLDVGDILTMGTEVAYPQVTKTIKELPIKHGLDGTEKLIVEDNEATKQAPLGTIVDEIKQNSQEKIREIESDLAQTNAQLSDVGLYIDHLGVNVKKFGAIGNQINDDTQAFKDTINYAIDNNISDIYIPDGIYLVSETIHLPVGFRLKANGKAKNRATIFYTGDGWAIATSGGFGEHRRNVIDGIGIYLKSTTAKGAILIGDENDDSVIPVQHVLSNIEIQDVGQNQIGIWLKNASGIDMTQVLCNRGTGGTGLLVSANGNNTGVMNFNNCSFGGHNQNDVGIELRHGSGGLDGFCFNGCYFGGKKPFLIPGSSAVKNICINACHVETTTDENDQYYGFDINSVVGLTINSLTLFGKRDEKFCGFIFRGTCRNVVIQGVDCNEFKGGTLYKYSGTSKNDFTHSLLFEGTPTGVERNVVQTDGDFTNVTLVSSDGKLITNQLNANRIESSDLVACSRLKAISQIITGPNNNKIQFVSQKPTTGIARGDYFVNLTPVELGTTGSKYIIDGWRGVGTDTVVECRCLTGN